MTRQLQDLIRQRQLLVDEGEADRKAVGQALADHKKASRPKFSDLRVSWKENGQTQKVEFKGAMTPETFLGSVKGIPNAVIRQSTRKAAGGPTLFQMRQAFRRRQDDRQTKLYHLDEQIRSLRAKEVPEATQPAPKAAPAAPKAAQPEQF